MLQVGFKPRVFLDCSLTSATCFSDSLLNRCGTSNFASLKFKSTRSYSISRQSGSFRNTGDSSITENLRLNSSKDSALPLIKKRAKKFESLFYSFFRIHALSCSMNTRNGQVILLQTLNTLLEAAKKTPCYVLFYEALFTGMRRSELLALRWCDVDLLLCQAHITRSLHHLRTGEIVFRAPKTAKARRMVSLPSSAALLLQEYRDKQEAQ